MLIQALRMTVVGVGVGIAAAFWLTRLLRARLLSVKSFDPLTFAVVPLILLAIALLAAYTPALRATRIDPLTALRHE